MKKTVFSILAIGLVLSSCVKENKGLEPAAPKCPFPETITAIMDEDVTKTDYDANGIFSWKENDAVRLIVSNSENYQGYYGYKATTIENNGKYAIFTADNGSGPIVDFSNDTWTSTGFAIYPYTISRPQSGTEYNGYGAPFVTLRQAVSGNKSDIILVGQAMSDNSNFKFKTAMSVLKVTLKNIPAEASAVALVSDQDVFPINGDFLIQSDGSFLYTKYGTSHTGVGMQAVDLSGDGAIESRDFYFNIPVGTCPANTLSLKVYVGESVHFEKNIAREINFERNKLIESPALEVPQPEWTSIGTGKFIDHYVWPYAGLQHSAYKEVEFFQSATTSTLFRIAKPYPGENADEWFVFDVSDPDAVASNPYFTDVQVNTAATPFKAVVRNGDYGYNFSSVLEWQANGMPSSVQIGPCYRGDEFYTSDSPYDYQIGKDHEMKVIEIVFPGCEPSSRVRLTPDTVYASDVCSHDGTGLKGLLDWDVTTYWHSNWYYAVTGNDSVYGIYFDITPDTPIQNFHFEYVVRSTNASARPTEIVIGASNEGSSWTKLTTFATTEMSSAQAGQTVVLPSFEAGSAYKYIRFGITDSANTNEGSLVGDLNFDGSKKCTSLAELALYVD